MYSGSSGPCMLGNLNFWSIGFSESYILHWRYRLHYWTFTSLKPATFATGSWNLWKNVISLDFKLASKDLWRRNWDPIANWYTTFLPRTGPSGNRLKEMLAKLRVAAKNRRSESSKKEEDEKLSPVSPMDKVYTGLFGFGRLSSLIRTFSAGIVQNYAKSWTR